MANDGKSSNKDIGKVLMSFTGWSTSKDRNTDSDEIT